MEVVQCLMRYNINYIINSTSFISIAIVALESNANGQIGYDQQSCTNKHTQMYTSGTAIHLPSFYCIEF